MIVQSSVGAAAPGVVVRVVALLATYNEERFLDACVENLASQGVDVYVIDNESTDRTLERANAHLGAGVIGIESVPARRHVPLARDSRAQGAAR